MLLRSAVAALGVTIGVAAAAVHFRPSAETATPSETTAPAAAPATGERFPVEVSAPTGPPRVDTGRVDAAGRPVTASCTTCHASRSADPAVRRAEDLDEFHTGLVFAHGTLACLACHDPDDYDRLRLADGSPLAYPQVMTLCGQCHAARLRDFEHGAHGGMTGYWDLTRGPRRRRGCLDCHDPHAPAFPSMIPTFKPIDRFLTPEDHHE